MPVMIGSIQKDIEIPLGIRSVGRPKGAVRETLEKMSVGDSVLFEFTEEDIQLECQKIKAVANTIFLKTGRKLSGRRIDNCLRMWRIE